jgi:heavy metal translocating P-type ATPase
MTHSHKSCCNSSPARHNSDGEPGSHKFTSAAGSCEFNTCCGEVEVATHPAAADSGERHGCGCSHSTTSHEDLTSGAPPVSHESRGHCNDLASDPTSCSPAMSCCEGNSCCAGKSSRDLPLDTDQSSRSIEVKDAASSTIIEIDKVDGDDSSLSKFEITLSVSGMNCTGCLKKLERTLDSILEISNVKASLLLSQATFDLEETHILTKDNISQVIEKKTGFTCALIHHTGEELELILDPKATALGDEWPNGVVDITATGKRRVLVSYRPRTIGARDLLSDPFFQHTALAPPPMPPSVASGRANVRSSLYLTLISTILTIPVLVFSYSSLPDHEVLYGGISCGLATGVQIIIVGPFYDKAFKALFFSRMIEMDLLIVLSTTVAYVYSVVAYGFLVSGKPLSTGEFFETSTLLATLIMVGRTVAEYARYKAVESISMESLQNPSAIIIEEGGEEREIDARLLQYNDTFKVPPEMSVVTDGVIEEGMTEVDESMITGEATLIVKKPGMPVIAGSVNHTGTILVKLTRLPSENTIKTISTMVDEAKSSKPKIQDIADRVAGSFVPVILAITVLVFIVWVAVGHYIRHQSSATAAINAMTFAISTLIVSCPCAIGLAVPMVVLIAGGVGAKHGLILKSTETIEIGRKISHVIFDKTGTLTQGKLAVVEEECPSESLLALVLGLITDSKHPVSLAVASHLKEKGIKALPVENLESLPGKGIKGTWKESTVRAGNPYWLGVEKRPEVDRVLSKALTVFCITVDGALIAVFGLRDELRPDAIKTVNELRKRNIEISLISGDNLPVVQALATHLGIVPQNTRARCTPADKQIYVKSALETPNKVVLFCGDGTNDAVALAQASIGLHINEGTDVAQSAADAILMRPSLKGILTLIDLSRAFWRRVLFNFAWSFVYNLFAILLAAGAFPGKARIPPQFAGLGELVSVLPVIAVAVGLRWKKF